MESLLINLEVKRNNVKALKLSDEESAMLDQLYQKRLQEGKSDSMSHLLRQLIYCGLSENTKIKQ